MGNYKEFPLLYFNLGGEMMYIIQQRLDAQNVDREKSAKVLNDILSTLLNRKFLRNLFSFESPAPSVTCVKSLYEKIVHVSIMKLAPESMDKLFDLMMMGVKHQMFQVPSAELMIAVTLNHIDSWKHMSADPDILLQINHAHSAFVEAYTHESTWTLQRIRWSLLNYLLGWKIRVSVFLKKQIQTDNGHFCADLQQSLPPAFAKPGSIRYLQDPSRESKFQFPVDCPISPGGYCADFFGGRGTQLGTNVYATEEPNGAKFKCNEKLLLNSLLLGDTVRMAGKEQNPLELKLNKEEDPDNLALNEDCRIGFVLETEVVQKTVEELDFSGQLAEVDVNLLDLMDEALTLS